jgi:hypothetical protein
MLPTLVRQPAASRFRNPGAIALGLRNREAASRQAREVERAFTDHSRCIQSARRPALKALAYRDLYIPRIRPKMCRMGSLPPPLPPRSPSPPLAGVAYRTAPVTGDASWETVAFLNTAEWHAARRLLSRQGILSRVGPDSNANDDMELQVPVTEVEWARELLHGNTSDLPNAGAPTGGFPVVTTSAEPIPPAMRTDLPLRAMSVGPMSNAGPRGVGYVLLLTGLWIALILLVGSMIWIWFW